MPIPDIIIRVNSWKKTNEFMTKMYVLHIEDTIQA